MSLRPNPRTEERKKTYKLGVDTDEGRRRREDYMVTIRKNKRENLFKKRRNVMVPDQSHQLVDVSSQADAIVEERVENIQLMVKGVWSDVPTAQIEATRQFRKLLSVNCGSNDVATIEEVIKSGVIPKFVEFLGRHDLPLLQFEAAWALANVVSGKSEHTRVVLEHGALPMFIQLLNSNYDNVREQAVWGIGNISGDSSSCRDMVLNNGVMEPLLRQINERSKLSMLRNVAWTLSNLCQGKPLVKYEQILPASPVFRQLIYMDDEEVLSNTCWALCHFSDDACAEAFDNVGVIIHAGVCERLVELLSHESVSIAVPALKTIGNIVNGDVPRIQLMINKQVLPPLYPLLIQPYKKSVVEEACWLISNITAGSMSQIQAVIDSNIIPPLISLLRGAEFGIKLEAAWVISNATFGASRAQIRYLADQGCLEPLCNLLASSDLSMLAACLEGLEHILEKGRMDKEAGLNGGINVYAEMIKEFNGVEKIEDLQDHEHNGVCNKVLDMMVKYWDKY